jgi:hypothetical protein
LYSSRHFIALNDGIHKSPKESAMKKNPTTLNLALTAIIILVEVIRSTALAQAPIPQPCPVVYDNPPPIIDRKVLDDEADVRFYKRHPELRGRKLNQHDDEALFKEWRVIRQQVQANAITDRAN